MLNAGSRNDDDGRFRLAMASAGIGMAIVDLDGRWLEVNPAIERLFGYRADALIGRPVAAMSHPDDIDDVRKAIADLASGGQDSFDALRRYMRHDGEVVWVQLNVAVMRDAQGEAIYFISQLRDVSAQHHAEQALQDCNGVLERQLAERNAEIAAGIRQQESFAHGISHDLRAPLRAIDSFSGLLNTHAGDTLDEVGRDYLQRIRNATTQMSSLIDGLLEFSRASRAAQRMQTVDVSLLVDWSLAERADADPERVTAIDVQQDLQAVGDERQLKLLFDQLLHNAWKFSRDRDRVEIVVRGRRDGDRLLMSIADRGVGFDMRYADKLFEPFQRLHGPEQGGGNGIGLAIAHRIVERHGGRLWAESEPGHGSTLHVELPAPAASENEA